MENKSQYQKYLEAVKKNGMLLQFVNKQTEEICLEAVKAIPRCMGTCTGRSNKSMD